MGLVAAFVRNPVKVAVGVLLILLFGVIAVIQLPVQLVPEVQRPVITVTTPWPGASPKEVEREIVNEQEEQLKGVEGVLKMSSESQNSQGTVSLEFEVGTAHRVRDDALNGFLPESFAQVIYMRDRPVLPDVAETLAVDAAGRPAVFRIGDNAYGFLGNPGIKLGMVEDLIMEFEEVPAGAADKLEHLRLRQREIEDNLVPIMTGLVQCTSLMSSPKAAELTKAELEKNVV